MITQIADRNIGSYSASSKDIVVEYRGLSTDDKPTNAQNGSVFVEMDTKKIYFYDKAGTTWREF